jgi:hypothetical protein
MVVEADRLAEQVKLAYEFIEVLHGQAIALIKEVETQLGQQDGLRFLQPGGYRFAINPQSYGLENPEVPMADYYAVCFRRFDGRVRNTPFDGEVPPVGFLKVVFREPQLIHPEVRFGVFAELAKPKERDHSYPSKVEDVVNQLAQRALVGPPWIDRGEVRESYEHAYVTARCRGRGVKLAEVSDSEDVARHIIQPVVKMLIAAKGKIAKNHGRGT